MGNAARDKWMARAATYESIVVREGHRAAKKYLDRFKGKLEQFMKGMTELQIEREEIAEESAWEKTRTDDIDDDDELYGEDRN